jgi:hypothetical protein
MSDSQFFLGRLYDQTQKQLTDKDVFYDPADLTTHAVVTGMTGSGKTGLCLVMLEEAALQGIPALVIDPKGDLTNLLLHFPNLAPQDFQPWIDPELARRSGKSLEQAALDAASSWRDGLHEWGISLDRMKALRNAAQFAIYTPGSNAGIPVSILSSLAAPGIPWEPNREILREKISSTVTALLGLVGLDDLDPLSSREHILLSNIFESAWSQGKSLDLTELILQTQTPPFDKLGAFTIDKFFPAKARNALALQLNNILASPVFEAWREGQQLNINEMLFMPDGRPRHSVFYLAHLSDAERMFFITLFLTAVETWMRTQAGATSLRAVLYMDEVFGYLPPQSNPPSKKPMLRLLKQARAFGLGVLLATQNPVDLDYKALSNAGTWFIGKLQTEQDKARLLDGLESAAGDVSRSVMDRLISSLQKRIFILHNVHARQPAIFQTRWAMNFLAGPLTRSQIPALNELAGAEWLAGVPEAQPSAKDLGLGSQHPAESDPVGPTVSPQDHSGAVPISKEDSPGSVTRPAVPAGVDEFFLPTVYSLTEALRVSGRSLPDAKLQGVFYRPSLIASAQVRFQDRKLGVDTEITRVALVHQNDLDGFLRWEDHFLANFVADRVESDPGPGARFSAVEEPFGNSKNMTALQRDFVNWVYRSTEVKVRANTALKVYAGPDVSQAEFMKACADTAREARDSEVKKKNAQFDKQAKTLKDKISSEQRELKEDEAELSHRKTEELGTHVENVLGVFGGRRNSRRLSTSLTKRRLTEQAKSEVEESLDTLEDLEKRVAEIELERKQSLAEISDHWGDLVNDVSEIDLTPKKSAIFIDMFGLAWFPYYLVESHGSVYEVPAFATE